MIKYEAHIKEKEEETPEAERTETSKEHQTIVKLIEDFSNVRNNYSDRLKKKYAMSVIGLVIGFFVSIFAILPAMKLVLIRTKNTDTTRQILKKYIPADAQFSQ